MSVSIRSAYDYPLVSLCPRVSVSVPLRSVCDYVPVSLRARVSVSVTVYTRVFPYSYVSFGVGRNHVSVWDGTM